MSLIIDNIICIIVVVILLLSIALQKTSIEKTTKRFLLLAYMVLGYLMADTISDLLQGKPALTVPAYFVNAASFFLIDGMIITFSAYLDTLIAHTDERWKRVMNPGVFFTYIRIVVIAALMVTGDLFIIDENGYYQELDFIIIPYVLLFFILIMLAIVVVRNRSHFDRQQVIIMLVYLLLPITGGALDLVLGCYVFTNISVTVSLLLIYTMIQSGILEGYRVRAAVLEEISSTDLLTNLNNRRAYYARFAALEPQEGVGVVFCDINGLKYTNDTYGHAEGDRLIIRFSKILSEVFRTNDIFRISGDEFVVITPEASRDNFNAEVARLQKRIEENHSIAAFGAAYGTGEHVEKLVSVAESAMYENKREYYVQNHIQRGSKA